MRVFNFSKANVGHALRRFMSFANKPAGWNEIFTSIPFLYPIYKQRFWYWIWIRGSTARILQGIHETTFETLRLSYTSACLLMRHRCTNLYSKLSLCAPNYLGNVMKRSLVVIMLLDSTWDDEIHRGRRMFLLRHEATRNASFPGGRLAFPRWYSM